MKKFVLYIFTCSLILSNYLIISAQYIQIPIEDKYQSSELIVEGKVISMRSYLTDNDMILTENFVEKKILLKEVQKKVHLSQL